MMTGDRLPPFARRINRLIAGAFTRHAPLEEVVRFLDDAAADAWQTRRWRGLAMFAGDVGRELFFVATRRHARPVTAAVRRDTRLAQIVRSSPMDRLLADVRYASRTLSRTPGFTLIAIITLALGIGAATAVYAVVDGAIMRPFSYPDMRSIVLLGERNRETGQAISVSWPNFLDWRAGNDVLRELGIYRGVTLNLGGASSPERLVGALMSASVFETMGIAPRRGRVFTAAEDEAGVGRIAIVSERLWRTQFGARDDLVGSDVLLNNESYRIVGVMPAGMRFPSRLTDVWLPLGLFVRSFPVDRGNHPGLSAVGRLKPGVSLEQARTAMDVVARRLEAEYPQSNRHAAISVTSYHEAIVENVRPAMTMLLAAVGLLVLIACANLASLCLARTESRQRELTVRAAIGAGRGRLIRQILIESGLLALAGGMLGVLVAYGAVQLFVATRPTTIPRIDLIAIDWRVLGFAALVSLGTVLLFAVAPAIRASKPDLQGVLRDGRSASVLGAIRLRRALVGGQLAVAMVLLVGAGLVLKSLTRLQNIPTGFDPSRVITMRLALPDAKYPTPEAWMAFHTRLVSELSGIAGIDAVGINSALPMEGGGSESPVIKEGDPPPTPERPPSACLFQTTGGAYFEAMGIPLLRGRTFDARDRSGSTPVIIVDEALAAKMFPGENPIGRRVAFENEGKGHFDHRPIFREIVGVVGTVKHYGLRADQRFLQVYVPIGQLAFWQRNRRPAMAIAARTALDPAALVPTVRTAVARIDPTLPVYGVEAMSRYVNAETEQERLTGMLLSGFAAIALILAVIGVYGVLSYAVTLRRREIGVRIALGAGRRRIVSEIVRQGGAMAAAGLVVGAGLAYLSSRLVESQLYEVSPTDASTYVAVAALLGVVALVASALPARRASAVDPIVALRSD